MEKIIKTIKKNYEKANGKGSWKKALNTFIVFPPEITFEYLSKFAKTNGFKYADKALKNGLIGELADDETPNT